MVHENNNVIPVRLHQARSTSPFGRVSLSLSCRFIFNATKHRNRTSNLSPHRFVVVSWILFYKNSLHSCKIMSLQNHRQIRLCRIGTLRISLSNDSLVDFVNFSNLQSHLVSLVFCKPIIIFKSTGTNHYDSVPVASAPKHVINLAKVLVDY